MQDELLKMFGSGAYGQGDGHEQPSEKKTNRPQEASPGQGQFHTVSIHQKVVWTKQGSFPVDTGKIID
jgi:hypothetical protein